MNNKLNTFYKQLAALFLMLNLLFVYIFQITHSHHNKTHTPTSNFSKKIIQETKNFIDSANCVFCEQQFIKDIDNYTSFPSFSVLITIYKKKLFNPYKVSLFSNSIFFENRGPPTCIA